ncbi:MAG TPA: sigma-54 dependent transcriptional regulator [Bryobacteraceae bacterium]|nr:sigma-54 dependent transcriptional regulator [Bryobacteraceae bacterium]
MPLQRVLWLVNANEESASTGYETLPPGLGLSRVTSLDEALAAIRSEKIDCVLISAQPEGRERHAILELFLDADVHLPIIFWDRDLSARQAIQLVREGAYTCLGGRDDWNAALESITQACEEKERRDRAHAGTPNTEPWRRKLVGNSAAMEDVANTIRLVGPFRCTVLITGETGTGKEMAARALHSASPRANLPMVAVNCSAVPENLLEAELFGHVKGAFTGAIGQRIGRFEQAHKSTIFLDEISDMPLELQAKLLRVLQEREFQRLGSSDTIQVDVRVIAATNVNLLDRVRQGKFREDLYYRLNVVPLEMPPLRKRPADIPLLVEHFTSKVCQNEGIPLKKITPKTFDRLLTMPWPGNVRQLENAVEKAIALSGLRDTLHPSDFGLTDSYRPPLDAAVPAPMLISGPMDFAEAVSQFERSILQSALAKTNGNKTAAAELLGLKRTTLIMKLRGLGDPSWAAQRPA